MTPCDLFRIRLEAWLLAPMEAGPRARLEADPHPAACPRCRTLFEGETALEHLLAEVGSGEAPPAGLTRRVLARLEAARDVAPLGAALDRLVVDPSPAGLAQRVLAELADARAVEPWLARLPEPEPPPADLVERIREGVRAADGERHAPSRAVPAGPRRLRSVLPVLLAAAAALLLWFGPWSFAPGPGEVEPRLAGGGAEDPSRELLAALDLLEDWDLLVGERELALLLGGLDEFDLWLLESESEDELPSGEPAGGERVR